MTILTRNGWSGRITAQTFVIGGGASSHIPQDRVAELVRRIPGAASVTIPAGHLIHATDPEAFTQAALSFLQPGRAPAEGAAQFR